MKDIAAVILAAGQGKRMNSDLPKVLHPILGRPMIEHLLNTLTTLDIDKIVVVVGYKADQVRQALEGFKDTVEFALQAEQLGTGHAVMMAEKSMKEFKGDILVLAGDVPFLSADTISNLVEAHQREQAAATVLSSIPTDPTGYGRIIRLSNTDLVDKIVEHKDATEDQRKIGEINSGTFVFSNDYLFEALHEVRADNSQKEFYLTDVMEILRQKGRKTAVYLTKYPEEVMGINSAEQLAELRARHARSLKN